VGDAPEKAKVDAKGASEAIPKSASVSVRSLWPLGALAVGAAALVGGAVWSVANKPKIEIESPLKEVRKLCEAGSYEEALDVLNTKALVYVNLPEARDEDLRDYFLLRAGALYDAQTKAGVERPENYKAVISDFEDAEKRGAALSPADTVRIAEAYLATEQTDRALVRAKSLPATEGARRRKLIKAIVERSIRQAGSGGSSTGDVMTLLAGLAVEPDLSPEDGAWTLSRQAELLIGIGVPQDAISKLMREIQLLKEVGKEQMGELYFLLGRAYYETGEHAESERQLERAMGMLNSSDPKQGHALLMLGHMEQSNGQLTEAREHFERVVEDFSGSEFYLPSLLGLASVDATLGEDDASLEMYARLVEQLTQLGVRSGSSEQARSIGVKIDDVVAGLMSRHEDRIQADLTREALRYAVMAESLHAGDEVPEAVLLALASTSRRLGNEMMNPADADASRAVDQATREEAKRLIMSAGVYYQRHARAVLVRDSGTAARSRWEAADAFDAAGDADMAIKEYTTYMQGASDDDPRRPEAKFRLAQAFQGMGDYPTAASLYRELIDLRGPGGSTEIVLWGDRSIVPLVQCLLSDADATNDADAEQRLLAVVAGRELAPEAPEFRDALVELGALYYRAGRYAEAVERLTEAELRFPKDREITRTRYRLADSLRLSAGQIDLTLRNAMPQSERQELEKARRTRRREAMRIYAVVRGALEAAPQAALRELDRVMLRNSMFYQGDCAYDLGDFDAAIEYYDQARQTYAAEPASLVAMVQIVNTYVQRGEWSKAVTANQRAVQQLEKFPESVWNQPNLPMEKKHWARWLDSRALLEHRASASGGAGAE